MKHKSVPPVPSRIIHQQQIHAVHINNKIHIIHDSDKFQKFFILYHKEQTLKMKKN